MTDSSKLAAIRQELPAVTDCVYLNTGTCGPLPRRAADAICRETGHELNHGRIDFDDFVRVFEAVGQVRQSLARLLGADADEIALTHHTTDGMNIGTWGLDWRPGDELITTTLEHEGGLMPAYMAGRRQRLGLRVVDLGAGEGDVVGQLEAAITPRTRLISLSHVSYTTGARLPLAEIVDMAHRHHVLVLVDAAQSAGAIQFDAQQLGVDMVAVPGQKWLCGPEGIGALYVRRDCWSMLSPTFVGFLSLWPDMKMDRTGQFLLSPDARRYEIGSRFRPGVFAMLESLRWLEDPAEVGWEWAFRRIEHLAHVAAGLLDDLPGVRLVTPANRAGLISFAVDGPGPDQLVAALAERRIRVRAIHPLDCLRASTGFYNTEEDLTALRDALAQVMHELA